MWSLMFQPLRKYADFKGRARRTEYWLFSLLFIALYAPFAILGGVYDEATPETALGYTSLAIAILVVLGLFIPALAVTVRRLHDTNRSAWWLLLVLVPILGFVVLLVFYVLPGTRGPNRFGPDPKGPEVEPNAPVLVS